MSDGEFTSDTALVTLNVEPVNDPPELEFIDNQIMLEDESLIIDLIASDIENDSLIFSAYSDTLSVFTEIINNQLYITSDQDYNGESLITVVVEEFDDAISLFLGQPKYKYQINRSSNSRLEDSQTFTLSVLPVNDIPITNDIDIELDEDNTVEVPFDGFDIDEDVLEYIILEYPQNGTINIINNNFVYTPDYNFYGEDSFTYYAFDGEFYSDDSLVSIIINSVDDEIEIIDITPSDFEQSIYETDSIYFSIDAFDPDGNDLEYSWKLNNIEQSTESNYTFSTDYGSEGYYILTLDVTDNYTSFLLADNHQTNINRDDLFLTWNITVNNTNRPPVAEDIIVETDEDISIEIELLGTDLDEDLLNFNVIDPPQNGDYQNGIYTPNPNWFGIDSFTYVANDGTEDSNEATVTITVQAIADPPSDFVLLAPVDDTIIEINSENLDNSVMFLWQESIDPDDGLITYTFVGYEGLEIINFNTDQTINFITYEDIANLMYEADLTEISGYWAILASDGEQSTLSNTLNLSFTTNSLSLEEILPEEFSITSIYPNPFNPRTTINFSLPNSSNVNIKIYDIYGREVETLIDQFYNAGYHSVIWNANNKPTGIYFLSIKAGNFIGNRKMMLIK